MEGDAQAGRDPPPANETAGQRVANSRGLAELPSILQSCLDELHQARNLHEEINDNYPDCGRLLDRCMFFLPSIDEAPDDAAIEPFEALLTTIREILIFCRTFLLSSIYRTLIAPNNRKHHLASLVRHHSAIWRCVNSLNISQRIHRQEWRHQDIEDARQAFGLCVNRLLDDYSELGTQADDLITELLLHIESNQPFISDLIQQIGHDPLLSYEQDLITRELVALQITVRQHHAAILAKPSVSMSSPSTDDEGVRKTIRSSLIQPHLLSPHQIVISSTSLGKVSPWGEVFQGTFQQTIPVAIKVLSLRPHSTDKFAREIRQLEDQVLVLRHLAHSCIVKCYGIVHTNIHVMRVTELTAYGSMEKLLASSLTWPVELPLAWIYDLIDALTYLHSQGIHHGEWQCAHILVHTGLRLKLYAFGIGGPSTSTSTSSRPNGWNGEDPRSVSSATADWSPNGKKNNGSNSSGGGRGGYGMGGNRSSTREEDWMAEDLQSWARCALQLFTRKIPQATKGLRREEKHWKDIKDVLKSMKPTPRKEVLRWVERCSGQKGMVEDEWGKMENERWTAEQVRTGLALVMTMTGGDWRETPAGQELERHVQEYRQGQLTTTRVWETTGTGSGKGTGRGGRSRGLTLPSHGSRSLSPASPLSPPAEANPLPELSMEEVQALARKINLRDAALTNDLTQVRILEQYRAWSFVPEINRKYAFEAQGWYTFGNVTALGIACSLGHAELVSLLMHHPYIELNENNNEYGWAPLHFATDKGHSEVVRVLLHGGMLDVNRRTKGGETALFMACAWGHGSLVQLLLSDPRTDVNIPKKSWSSLHKATDKGQVDIARDLLAHPKIDVNLATDLGDTALHLAAYNGDLACLEVLLSHSALEVNRTNVDGQTALDILCHGYFVSEEHKEEMARLLKKRGAISPFASTHTVPPHDHPIEVQPGIL